MKLKAVDLNLEWRLNVRGGFSSHDLATSQWSSLYCFATITYVKIPKQYIKQLFNHKPPTSFPLYASFFGDAKGIDKMQKMEKFSI